MALRVLTLIAVCVTVALALVVTRLYGRHCRLQAQALPHDQLWGALGTRPDGRATIVDFSTPACGDCKVQAQQLKVLTARGIRVLEVDATAQLGVARAFGVFSAPSTVVLAGDGRLLGINRGLTSDRDLQAQLDLDGRPAR